MLDFRQVMVGIAVGLTAGGGLDLMKTQKLARSLESHLQAPQLMAVV
jgi:hypothetical protein